MHKLRMETCAQIRLPAVVAHAEVSFTEFPISMPDRAKFVTVSNTVAVISVNSITLEISNDVSESLLCPLLNEVAHV